MYITQAHCEWCRLEEKENYQQKNYECIFSMLERLCEECNILHKI